MSSMPVYVINRSINQSLLIAPPRSSLRMRTLRGGARYYVEKLNRRAKDRICILQTAAISRGKRRRNAFRHFASRSGRTQGGLSPCLPLALPSLPSTPSPPPAPALPQAPPVTAASPLPTAPLAPSPPAPSPQAPSPPAPSLPAPSLPAPSLTTPEPAPFASQGLMVHAYRRENALAPQA